MLPLPANTTLSVGPQIASNQTSVKGKQWADDK